jgi:serine/threonine-protein kinase
MGSVYRGMQLATGQVVAIKLIRADVAEDVEAIRRFHREVRSASRLAHPHTIRVVDFGESEAGDLFMVMEHLSGRTLGAALRQTVRLDEARLAKIGAEVAQSLAEAHSEGLAHRDLKPENVMLVDSFGDPDFVKVLDFGIAKFLSGSSGESSVTRTGAVVGTPHYMSPEQARGSRHLTGAVDVYALGVMLFEGLSGRKPFDGDSAVAILMAHVNQPVPPIPFTVPASDGIRALVSRMLGKEPDQRPDAGEVARELERIRMVALMRGGGYAGGAPQTSGSGARPSPTPTPLPPLTLIDPRAMASNLPDSVMSERVVLDDRIPPCLEPPGPVASDAVPVPEDLTPTRAVTPTPARLEALSTPPVLPMEYLGSLEDETRVAGAVPVLNPGAGSKSRGKSRWTMFVVLVLILAGGGGAGIWMAGAFESPLPADSPFEASSTGMPDAQEAVVPVPEPDARSDDTPPSEDSGADAPASDKEDESDSRAEPLPPPDTAPTVQAHQEPEPAPAPEVRKAPSRPRKPSRPARKTPTTYDLID